MITIVLLFFGAVFIYTGILVVEQEPTAAAVSAVIGILLAAGPAMKGMVYLRANFFKQGRTAPQRQKPRKTHLKVVEPRDKKPTIH